MAEADVLPLEATEAGQTLSPAGDRLREARERLGIDRGEVSVRTKINERHLAAIEDGDFTALPARIYAVGFARSYAVAVGLDSGAIAAQVRAELDEQETPVAARPTYDLDIDDPAKIPSRRLAWIAAVLAVALIATGTVLWRSHFVPAIDLPAVRERPVTAAVASPEPSATAMVDPAVPGAPGQAARADALETGPSPVGAAPRPAARSRGAPHAAAPARAVQSLPSPVPERLQPLDAVQTQPAPSPANAPAL